MRVGEEWAWTDPAAALAQAATLSPDVQADYRDRVTAEWARLDPDGFLAHAERAADPEPLMAGLQRLIAVAPLRVFEIAARLTNGPPAGPNALQTAAMRAVAEQNPVSALQRLTSLPAGQARDALSATVLSVYARANPDAALAWLEARDMPSSSDRWAVIRGIALADFERGYALTVEEPGTLRRSFADALVGDPVQTAEVATRVLEQSAPRADEILSAMVETWVRRDPERAIAWVIDNAGAIDSSLAQLVGRTLATTDFESAISYLDRLPVEMRDTWIAQIAQPFADRDPAGALYWAAQYQGQATYAEALSQIVMRAATSRPELVVPLFPRLTPALQATAAPRVAAAWAKHDTQGALAWVLGLEGSAANSRALAEVVTRWARKDVEDATKWAMNLPRGERRDSALHAVISSGQLSDPRAVIAAIDSDGMRRTAKTYAIGGVATSRDVAIALLETLVDDPEFGQWARESLGLPPGARP
jgi:hypothetical protein